MLCVVRYRSLRRADHSSRDVLLSVVRRCVRSRNFVNEWAMAHWGGGRLCQKSIIKRVYVQIKYVNVWMRERERE